MLQRSIEDQIPVFPAKSNRISENRCWETEIGVDEVGRGPLAGPVVAAAALLPSGHGIDGLADSKKLSEAGRRRLDMDIRDRAVFCIAWASVEEIDRLNIFQATMLAMTRAVAGLSQMIDIGARTIIVDGNHCPKWQWKSRALVGGDGLHPTISAASILAKQFRDAWMIKAAESFPEYAWERNKGYGTKAHIRALNEHGPTAWHRKSFTPVAQCALPLVMPRG